jgi:hypothetical protein
MSRAFLFFRIALLLVFVAGVTVEAAEKEKKPAEETPKPPLNREAGKLDIANSKEGDYPGGSTPIAGKWSVDAGAKKLNVAPEPLLDCRLEFGPEIREKGATIQGTARAPGEGRLKSRFGVGLYGKNGFQLRAVPATQEIELVRRGIVLAKTALDLNTEDLFSLELSVQSERNHWLISGRAWKSDEKRPAKVLLSYKMFADELLFPLAGRPAIVATPFSGKAVSFSAATAYYGEYQEATVEE